MGLGKVTVCNRIRSVMVLCAGLMTAGTYARAAMAAEVAKPREAETTSDAGAPKLSDYQELIDRNIFSRIHHKTKAEIAEEWQKQKDIEAARPRSPVDPTPRVAYVPNYDKDIVLIGILDKDTAAQAFFEDRHDRKILSAKEGDKIGSGKIGAITMTGIDFVGSSKTTKVAYGRNLEGGYSEQAAVDPAPVPPSLQGIGSEGMTFEEKMRLRRMKEMGLSPEVKPNENKTGETKPGDVKPGDTKPPEVKAADTKNSPDEPGISFEEKMRRRRMAEQGGATPPDNRGFQNFRPPDNQQGFRPDQNGFKTGDNQGNKPLEQPAAVKPADAPKPTLDDPDLSPEERLKLIRELLENADFTIRQADDAPPEKDVNK